MSTLPFGFTELLLAGRLVQSGNGETWTFEICLPVLPPRRSFLIAAGLEQAVSMLERFAAEGPDLSGLDPARLPAPLDASILESIESLRFSGSIEAVPEGTVVFAGEPVLRLQAPAAEAVLVGAAMVGALRSQTAVATKAARLVLAAGGKPVYEIGVRSAVREAALLAARSAHVGGASATANASAAMQYGLPTLPVLPLTLVAALGGELEGLEACGVYIDGALANEGDAALAVLTIPPRAILLDVGTRNLAARVAAMKAGILSLGWKTTRILVGGRVDEEAIDAMTKTGVDVDGFCVGGELIVAADSPCVAFDYELVERELDGHRTPLTRRDGGVGRRSVWRRREAGKFKSDTVQAESKPPPPGGMPLLVRVVEKGRRLFRAASLGEVRVLCGSQLSMIDPNVTRRVDPETYMVTCVTDKKEPPPRAEPPPKAPPPPATKAKSEPMKPADARARALLQNDDSADFSSVSGAFESVGAHHLRGSDDADAGADAEAVEPIDEAAAPVADEPDVVEEVPADETAHEIEAEAPAETDAIEFVDEVAVEAAPAEDAMEFAAPPEEAPSEELPIEEAPPAEAEELPLVEEASPAEELVEVPAEDFASMVEQLAPKRAGFEPAVRRDTSARDDATPDGIIEIVPPSPPPTEELEALPTFGNPELKRSAASEGNGYNPLIAAAARLRSMQRGEPTPKAAPPPAAVTKPAAADKKAPPTDSPSDPLLAAAARLKSMRGN